MKKNRCDRINRILCTRIVKIFKNNISSLSTALEIINYSRFNYAPMSKFESKKLTFSQSIQKSENIEKL